MSDQLPPALDDLREQLRAAAARDNEVEARVAQRVRRGRRRHWSLLALGALVSLSGVAVAERALDRRGADHRADEVPAGSAPAAEPGVVADSARADPGGGLPWAMRVFTNRAGQVCVTVGRLRHGIIGTVDASRTFRALPDQVPGACQSLASSGLLVAVHYDTAPPRTVVYGLTRDRRPVKVTIAGEMRTVAAGALGTFIDVREGVADMRGASAWTAVGGRRERQALGPPTRTSRTPR